MDIDFCTITIFSYIGPMLHKWERNNLSKCKLFITQLYMTSLRIIRLRKTHSENLIGYNSSIFHFLGIGYQQLRKLCPHVC
jgi:hypothetical protein